MLTHNSHQQHPIQKRWHLTVIWALCTPEIIAFCLYFLETSFLTKKWWGHFSNSPIFNFLDRIGNGGMLVTIVLGPICICVSAVLLFFVWKSRDFTDKMKKEAAVIVAFAFISCLWFYAIFRPWG